MVEVPPCDFIAIDCNYAATSDKEWNGPLSLSLYSARVFCGPSKITWMDIIILDPQLPKYWGLELGETQAD